MVKAGHGNKECDQLAFRQYVKTTVYLRQAMSTSDILFNCSNLVYNAVATLVHRLLSSTENMIMFRSIDFVNSMYTKNVLVLLTLVESFYSRHLNKWKTKHNLLIETYASGYLKSDSILCN